jgi:hypothetical protein
VKDIECNGPGSSAAKACEARFEADARFRPEPQGSRSSLGQESPGVFCHGDGGPVGA